MLTTLPLTIIMSNSSILIDNEKQHILRVNIIVHCSNCIKMI